MSGKNIPQNTVGTCGSVESIVNCNRGAWSQHSPQSTRAQASCGVAHVGRRDCRVVAVDAVAVSARAAARTTTMSAVAPVATVATVVTGTRVAD